MLGPLRDEFHWESDTLTALQIITEYVLVLFIEMRYLHFIYY